LRKVIGRVLNARMAQAFQRWVEWSASLWELRALLKRAVMRMLKVRRFTLKPMLKAPGLSA
jgi:hypothetical protein